ncbi:MAG: cysteine hydrolase [Candidatus Aenigmarchaeota archaeon]|nr:cysteine hydrolase [Candidatus Aenigmarchaeota archaeon]
MASALIVIDVQNYFVRGSSRSLPRKIAAFVRKNRYDVVLFTKFVNREGSNFFRTLGWKKCTRPPETDLHPALTALARKHHVFEKSTYSAFKSPGLVAFLKKHRVTSVALCGTNTDACVLASAFEGFDLGYRMEILTDLCSSRGGPGLHASAGKIIRENLRRGKATRTRGAASRP